MTQNTMSSRNDKWHSINYLLCREVIPNKVGTDTQHLTLLHSSLEIWPPVALIRVKKTQYYLALSPRCALYNISGFSSYRVTGSVKKEIIITSRVEEKEKESKGLQRY